MIRLLVVDDSALMRRLLADLFTGTGEFDVAVARDGVEALEAVRSFRPQVVTLDVRMPHMDGLSCLDRIMVEHPCPVVMVSALTEEGAEVTIDALGLGAVDFVAKPSGAVSLRMDALGPVLIEKVRAAAAARISTARRLTERVRLRNARLQPPPDAVRLPQEPFAERTPRAGAFASAVVIGCSTGGPPALDAVLQHLPADFPAPVLVAQHMPASFTGPLARRLDRLCALHVLEVTAPVPLAPGHVYVAHGEADLILGVRAGGIVTLPAPSHPDHPWHPSVDRLVDSAVEVLGAERLIGVLMTGMGHDGAAAMTRLRRAGGRTIAEAEESAVIWGMPGDLVRAGGAEFVAPLGRIAERLLSLVGAR